MRTKIIIRHDTAEALKSCALWQEITARFLVDGPVAVVEIGADDDDDVDEQHLTE